MKKKIYSIVLTIILSLTLTQFSCEFIEPVTEEDDITISGQVIDSITDDPVPNAAIRVTDGIIQVNITTDPEGRFSTVFTIDKDKDVTITISKNGYISETIIQRIKRGTNVTIPLISLIKVNITITGKVIETNSEDPVSNAFVEIIDGSIKANTETNANGEFSLDFYLVENKELTVFASKNGFIADTSKFLAAVGDSIKIPVIRLLKANVSITGKVIDFNAESPVQNASVKITDGSIQSNSVTNQNGEFSIDFFMTEDKELTIITSKVGFSADTLVFVANIGSSVLVPTITLINDVTIGGEVVESVSFIPLFNALVRVTDGTTEVSTRTREDGTFTAKFSTKQNKELLIITSKETYSTDTLKLYAEIGRSYLQIRREIKQAQGQGNSSGGPASIYLLSQSAISIGVKESGSNETAQIVFEVLDSIGVPIDLDHSTTLYFKFGGHPDGGEYLYPPSVQTNELGRALVTLNSGFKAGVAQVIAEMTVNNVLIKSQPVLISIHGGFPTQNHFDIAAEKLNYPAYGILAFPIDFLVLVGDKYSNPVRPGTSVYFETTSGNIQGSNTTDSLGTTTVTLLTQPSPNHPVYGPGFFEVTASTIDENNVIIYTSTVRLQSGGPQISADPATFNIPNGGSLLFTYTVSDANGNPLAEGTTISVTVAEGNINIIGDINPPPLPDTQTGFTNFSFTAYDSDPGTDDPQPAEIKIQTTGPNGPLSFSILGTSR